MLHAVWDQGLVVFGWRGRVLDRKTVASFASTLFVSLDGQTTYPLTLQPPDRRVTLQVQALRVEIDEAAEAFTEKAWVPWRSLSASLAWFSRAARLSQDVARAGLVLPQLTLDADGHGTASWQPVITEVVGQRMSELAKTMPGVVGALRPQWQPWQVTSVVVNALTDTLARSELVGTPVVDMAPGSRTTADVTARRFMGALTSPDPGINAQSPVEHLALQQLATAVGRWTAPGIGVASAVDLAVTLRVVEPNDLQVDENSPLYGLPPEDLPWLVEMLVSPLNDPSMQVLASDVATDTAKAALLGLTPDDHQRAMVLARRRVTRTSTVLAGVLTDPEQFDAPLALPDLIKFLRGDAARLERERIRVLLPAWWTKSPRAKIQGTAAPADQSVTPSGLDVASLVTVDWRLALDGDPLTESELARLAAAKHELVFLRNQWVHFDPDRINQALTALTKVRKEKSQLSAIGLVQAGADTSFELVGVDWIGELLAGLPDDRITAISEPPGFVGQLRPYQQRGLGWLAFLQRLHLGGCLADDMGLGKTAQLLALLAYERAAPPPPEPPLQLVPRGPGRPPKARTAEPVAVAVLPTLVICPLSVVRNWETESARFTPGLKVHVLHGTQRLKEDDLLAEIAKCDLVITTYATATKDVATLSKARWARLVADEAQHVKNPTTGAAKALRKIPAAQKIALTGTPVENKLTELWAVCDLVNPGLLGNATTFRQRFAVPIERHRDPEKTDELRRIVQPFLLRRSKSDRSLVPELPPKLEQVAYAALTREQATLYQSSVDMLLKTLEHLGGMERRGAILATITRLKQICNHPAHFLGDGNLAAGRSGKLARFDELVTDVLEADERMLVFTQYREMGLLLARHLREHAKIHAPFLHGGVTRANRDQMVDAFQHGAGGPILLVSLKAGGSGLNLTAASQVVHYDRWWNPAVENQASDRAWRIGQTRTVLVHKMVCQGTVEDRIDQLIESKKDLADRVVGAGENWITELTTSEIRDLLVLR